VSAILSGADLIVGGDAAANQIQISQNAAGDVLVQGLTGTRINGRPSVTFPGVNLIKADVKMGGGNDQVTLVGLSTDNDINVETGNGNDVVRLSGLAAGGVLNVKTGLGSDTVTGTGLAIEGDVGVVIAGGNSAVSLSSSSFGGSLRRSRWQRHDHLAPPSTKILTSKPAGNDIIRD
jgi:hypothetical protein